MKLLIFRYALAIGGAERYVETLLKGAPDNIEIAVATNNAEFAELVESFSAKPYLIPYVPEPFSKKQTIAFYFKSQFIKRVFKRVIDDFFSADGGVIFCQSLGEKILVTELVHRYYPGRFRVVWTEHGAMIGNIFRFPPLIRRYAKASFQDEVKSILCVSQSTAKNITQAGVDTSKLRVIYNGTKPVECPIRAKDGSSELVKLVSTSRLDWLKGYQQLFPVLKVLGSLPWRLTVVGDGPNRRELEELAKQLGLADRIDFVGFANDVGQFLCSADIYICSTIYPGEGMPISNVEALSAGLPIISSTFGGAGETVIDGQTGYLIDPFNIEMFADRLGRLISNAELRKKLGRSAREDWQKRFTVDNMVGSIYKELLQ